MPSPNGMERIFLSIISQFTVNDLEKAAKENKNLKPIAMSDKYIRSLIPMAKMLKLAYRRQYQDISSERIAYYLMDKRPDLANKILLDRRIKTWLTLQINDLKLIF